MPTNAHSRKLKLEDPVRYEKLRLRRAQQDRERRKRSFS